MNHPTSQAERMAVAESRAWTVLGAPLSWPWIGDGRTTVKFVRRDGERTHYLMSRAGASCEFSVRVHQLGATLHIAEQTTPGLSWEVAGDSQSCELTWEATHPLPEPLAAHWQQASGFGSAVEEWSRAVDAASGHTEPLGAASALMPLLHKRARDCARAFTLDAGVVAALRACGLFRIGVPRALGGLDLHPATIVKVIEQLSRADGATGWCTLIGNQSAYAGWLRPSSLGDLVGSDGQLVLAGSTAVSGSAERAGPGTYRVKGRWRFNSGCLHADWLMGGVTVPDDDGNLAPMLAFVPWTEATVLGTWDVAGLAGTGSHDLELTDVTVPAERLAPLFSGRSSFADPLHRLSPYNIQGVLLAGHPLGVARRALDELTALAAAGDAALPAREIEIDLARFETRLDAIRCQVLNTVDDYWEELGDKECLTARCEARLALVLRHLVDTAKNIVERAVRLAGPAVTEPEQDVLRRCLRDIYATGQHLAFSDDVYERNARRFVGTNAASVTEGGE